MQKEKAGVTVIRGGLEENVYSSVTTIHNLQTMEVYSTLKEFGARKKMNSNHNNRLGYEISVKDDGFYDNI